MLFKDQVAMVTGAGQGIGKAIAVAFAREGADIAVLDIDRETAEATAGEIRDTGRRVTVSVADVCVVEAVDTALHGSFESSNDSMCSSTTQAWRPERPSLRSRRPTGNVNSTSTCPGPSIECWKGGSS